MASPDTVLYSLTPDTVMGLCQNQMNPCPIKLSEKHQALLLQLVLSARAWELNYGQSIPDNTLLRTHHISSTVLVYVIHIDVMGETSSSIVRATNERQQSSGMATYTHFSTDYWQINSYSSMEQAEIETNKQERSRQYTA